MSSKSRDFEMWLFQNEKWTCWYAPYHDMGHMAHRVFRPIALWVFNKIEWSKWDDFRTKFNFFVGSKSIFQNPKIRCVEQRINLWWSHNAEWISLFGCKRRIIRTKNSHYRCHESKVWLDCDLELAGNWRKPKIWSSGNDRWGRAECYSES